MFGTDSASSCRTTQNRLPSVTREACGRPALARTLSHGRGHAPLPSSLSLEAHESHMIPWFSRAQEHAWPSPASLHINPRRFQPSKTSKHPGRPEDAIHSQLYRWHISDMGTRGGALSVTVGSCRCKQSRTRALSLTLLPTYIARRLMICDSI